MTDKTFSSPGVISKVTTLADGTVRLQFDSQELNPDGMSSLFNLFNQFGMMIFALPETPIETINEIELPEIQKPKGNNKSRSQKLREVMFLFWAQTGSKGEFQDYYDTQMDRLINHWREMLI